MDSCIGLITFFVLFSFPFLVFPSLPFFLTYWQTLSAFWQSHVISATCWKACIIYRTASQSSTLFSHLNTPVPVTAAAHTWVHLAVEDSWCFLMTWDLPAQISCAQGWAKRNYSILKNRTRSYFPECYLYLFLSRKCYNIYFSKSCSSKFLKTSPVSLHCGLLHWIIVLQDQWPTYAFHYFIKYWFLISSYFCPLLFFCCLNILRLLIDFCKANCWPPLFSYGLDIFLMAISTLREFFRIKS